MRLQRRGDGMRGVGVDTYSVIGPHNAVLARLHLVYDECAVTNTGVTQMDGGLELTFEAVVCVMFPPQLKHTRLRSFARHTRHKGSFPTPVSCDAQI